MSEGADNQFYKPLQPVIKKNVYSERLQAPTQIVHEAADLRNDLVLQCHLSQLVVARILASREFKDIVKRNFEDIRDITADACQNIHDKSLFKKGQHHQATRLLSLAYLIYLKKPSRAQIDEELLQAENPIVPYLIALFLRLHSDFRSVIDIWWVLLLTNIPGPFGSSSLGHAIEMLLTRETIDGVLFPLLPVGSKEACAIACSLRGSEQLVKSVPTVSTVILRNTDLEILSFPVVTTHYSDIGTWLEIDDSEGCCWRPLAMCVETRDLENLERLKRAVAKQQRKVAVIADTSARQLNFGFGKIIGTDSKKQDRTSDNEENVRHKSKNFETNKSIKNNFSSKQKPYSTRSNQKFYKKTYEPRQCSRGMKHSRERINYKYQEKSSSTSSRSLRYRRRYQSRE